MTKFNDFSEKYQPQVNTALKAEVAQQVPNQSSSDWGQMLTYALLTPGKRLRPLLALAVIDSFGQEITADAIQAATALEWVHAYSLVHDDLPEMDNDAYRRGQLSVHALYGPASAVLVGDALQAGAFSLLAALTEVSAEQKVAMVATLAEKAGANGMVLGQVLDMQNHDINEDQVALAAVLDQVYQKKTADLLQAAALIGGHYANLAAEDLDRLADFAGAFGLLFQIQDDLDDYDQDQEEGVVSLVHLVGLDQAHDLVVQLTKRANQALSDLTQENKNFDSELLTSLLAKIGA
ncbi:polyprenyl synthetase family protein [Fructobacillus evanidus]|uniref:Geranylgeranyl pyrophosphate synthase (IspA) n=1 Tax=Fructobacillus evanidus TaxID=3064281 RepID=A0ABM9MR57_9LACO|nr:Geranylgeranyl pyrophosphate synthase (IspA) [Fructobacillus sp. LMG 32999]CAK1230537.1 Geranylgeranyl pyrophosphate synthase (IspA) [Fructobacillus sp. LMG 32999]CAK1234121.1 Geranylgeranyl pyrophosphate synthase (IspA) [Fructobacillus sp. LMG 32999]CAK1236457.1 Geranylgeranyl pyrophosphate synthase (IspA) [Fructobacillus sp. LMG 32999]CAK1238121.1 Geranylgeranyl pyrophosphate synthase (IspA) [Fructobacillus sp. LMG 32999]